MITTNYTGFKISKSGLEWTAKRGDIELTARSFSTIISEVDNFWKETKRLRLIEGGCPTCDD